MKVGISYEHNDDCDSGRDTICSVSDGGDGDNGDGNYDGDTVCVPIVI